MTLDQTVNVDVLCRDGKRLNGANVTVYLNDKEIGGGSIQDDRVLLGSVDKVDSQISRSVIQDCFLGGSFGSRRPDRYGMADHRGVVAHRTRQEVPTVAR